MHKIAWKKGNGVFIVAVSMLLLVCTMALTFIQLFHIQQNGINTQTAADSIADGTAVYMAQEGGDYDDAKKEADKLKQIIAEKMGIDINEIAIDEKKLEENVVQINLKGEYELLPGITTDNGSQYEIKRGASTEFRGSNGKGTGQLANPCPAASVSSEFGPRSSPGGIGSTNHKGRDYAAPTGTPILASDNGIVTTVSSNSFRGKYLVISHGTGLETLYQHCSSISATVGQKVKKGDVIALVGSTGKVTGAHLHFEVHENGIPVDPRKYVSD